MSGLMYSNLAHKTEQEYTRLSMGLRPSGPLHIGTAIPFLIGVSYMAKNPKAVFEVQVMDLDFHHQMGKDFHAFPTLPDPWECHSYMSEHTLMESNLALGEIVDFFRVDPTNIRLSLFSSTTPHPMYQEFMRYIFLEQEGRQLVKSTVIGHKGKSTELLAPNCPSCGHSSTVTPKFCFESETLQATCFNKFCDVTRYTVPFLIPDDVNLQYNLFYLVDPIRDLIPNGNNRRVDAHCFGGDYALPYGMSGEPQGHRVLNLLRGVSDWYGTKCVCPDILIGKMLMFNGQKIGKSLKKTHALVDIREKRPDWVARLHDLLNDHPEQQKIELSLVDKYI